MTIREVMPMSEVKRQDNKSFRLPDNLAEEMDILIGTHGFTSRSEIAKQAIREYIDKHRPATQTQLPRYERINADSTGIKIFDRTLEGNKLVHVSISPIGIYCDHCETETCEHVKYALTQTDVQDIIKQKKKEGWKLP
ncbi:MAG: ribbon-helix-helix domain-containing protein [Candidatus Bathyarchaeota archaeon]|nr:ribbon-helix-helix domain-containing protein [Candidatus Termiticorpusculum sp.]